MLTLAAFAVVAVGVAMTVSPLAHRLGFTTLQWQFFTALVLFTILYRPRSAFAAIDRTLATCC